MAPDNIILGQWSGSDAVNALLVTRMGVCASLTVGKDVRSAMLLKSERSQAQLG